MTRYVLGFLIEKRTRRVVLITKSRPEWQAGKLNGVGGHIEEGEDALSAMRREWSEETGMPTSDWQFFRTIAGPDWACACYYASFYCEEPPMAFKASDEPAGWYDLGLLQEPYFRAKMVEGVPELLEQAIALAFPPDEKIVVTMHSTGFIHAPGMVENWQRMTGRYSELAFWQVALSFPDLSPMFIKDMLARRTPYKVEGTAVVFEPWEPGPLENYYDAERIQVVWTVDDVLTAANRVARILYRQEALEILHEADKDHDAFYGINWDVLSNLVDYRSDMGRALTEDEQQAVAEGDTLYLDTDDTVKCA